MQATMYQRPRKWCTSGAQALPRLPKRSSVQCSCHGATTVRPGRFSPANSGDHTLPFSAPGLMRVVSASRHGPRRDGATHTKMPSFQGAAAFRPGTRVVPVAT
ncbi:hypothetical protein MF672_018245 [Actinomadura sp. ATCC 31491]|uniref:DUF397 domain-containing protein n=1 Tax=Actinomadura luzonensis TaxID=2805427 RepID=A0ABT0FTR2_9ACTN|nr:hypothetical protein [Actinomadura luzonensis]MCK2215717.1 hypothetical protein [Actinomadura luzonensis]